MRPTIKIFLLLMVLPIFSTHLKACVCWQSYLSIDSLPQLAKYDFIALVKITDDQYYKKRSDNNSETIGLLTIKTIELFKGNADVTEILEYFKNTSCDIGISKDEEWILFGTISNGKMTVGPCDRNEKYKSANELRNWGYIGIDSYRLSQLRKLYLHPVRKYSNEVHQEFYKNGQKEIEETYINGKLNGERKIWHPNGTLIYNQNYKNDTLDGKYEAFYPTGQIYREDYYSMGEHRNITRIYYDTTVKPDYNEWLVEYYKTKDKKNFGYNRIQIKSEYVYDSSGHKLVSRVYSRLGKIIEEKITDPKGEYLMETRYNSKGMIEFIYYSFYINGKSYGQYKTFDKDGLPEKSLD